MVDVTTHIKQDPIRYRTMRYAASMLSMDTHIIATESRITLLDHAKNMMAAARAGADRPETPHHDASM